MEALQTDLRDLVAHRHHLEDQPEPELLPPARERRMSLSRPSSSSRPSTAKKLTGIEEGDNEEHSLSGDAIDDDHRGTRASVRSTKRAVAPQEDTTESDEMGMEDAEEDENEEEKANDQSSRPKPRVIVNKKKIVNKKRLPTRIIHEEV